MTCVKPPHSLLDLSAKIVAEHVPFQSIEKRYEHIPEPVQRRIIFWSFPRHEDDIKMYSSLSSDTFHSNAPQTSTPNGSNNSTSQSPSSNNNNNINSSNNNNNNAYAWIEHPAVQQSPPNLAQTSSTVPTYKSSNNNQQKQLTFHKGLRLYNEGCVHDVLQVGFNLSGQVTVRSIPTNQITSTNSRIRGNNNHSSNNNNIVNNNNNINNNLEIHNNNILNNPNQPQPTSTNDLPTSNDTTTAKSYRSFVAFDRCKITQVYCSCELEDIFWCEHVVALILYRIRNPDTIELRVPISETLLSLDRQQLQKLVQYIIAEHHTEVLPTAQRLLDEMRQSFSEINQFHGAPDPTAGACIDDEHIWHLDEFQVNEKVQNYLNLVCSNSKDAAKHIHALFEKIREMFRAKDSNGTRLLTLITEQFLLFATRNEKSRPLWDQLVSLWVVVMLNPDLRKSDKKNFIQLLNSWSKVAKCPKEDVDVRRVNLKRKASELSDDEDNDDHNSNSFGSDFHFSFKQSNNYPAHMATHRHRAFQSNGCLSTMRPYYPLPMLTSTCPHQISHSIAKEMRSNLMQHSNEQHLNPSLSRNYRSPSSSHHHSTSRNHANHSSILNENRSAAPQEPRSIFHRALDFQDSVWDDPHLQLILNNDGPMETGSIRKSKLSDFSFGNPLWNESISQAAARVETLRSHGYREQALRLTIATVRRLKLYQDQWCLAIQIPASKTSKESKRLSKWFDNYNESWIGHPFDPINVLIDILLDASLSELDGGFDKAASKIGLGAVNSMHCSCTYNQAFAGLTHRLLPELAQSLTYQHQVDGFPMMPLVNLAPRFSTATIQANTDKTPYYHNPVPGCCQKDSYLTLAVELALIALGQQRSIPTIPAAHDRAVRQEIELISKLEMVNISDPMLIEILKYQASLLLRGGPFQNSYCGASADVAPLHTFARYLFESLVAHDSDLAYMSGLHALKMPLLPSENGENSGAARTSPRTINQNYLQTEQLNLAQAMLSKAKDDGQLSKQWLDEVYKASIRNIRNPASLLKLSKHVLKEAKPNGLTLFPALLKTSFDFGLQVLKITLSPHTSNGKTRRDALLFIVECATDIGLEAVLQIMKKSREYFSATEALNLVVARDSDHVNLRTQALAKLKLKPSDQENKLNQRSRDLVLECANRDPTNCALEALKFCETDRDSLERAFKVIIDAGRCGSMDSSQLIKVADHFNERHCTDKAFTIAMVAVDSLTIPSNSDNSTSKKDIMSACEYARKVNGFSTLIPKLIKNIECATVLSEIYHQFGLKEIHNQSGLINQYVHDVTWWAALLEQTLKAFVDTTRSRLQNISPRRYGELIDFLSKAQEAFDKAPDGRQQFKDLISEIMKSYRTKKKLMEKLKARFDYSIKSSL